MEPRLLLTYGLSISNEIKRHQKYPPMAQRRGWEGTAEVLLQIAADGKVTRITLGKSSGTVGSRRSSAQHGAQGLAPAAGAAGPARPRTHGDRADRLQIAILNFLRSPGMVVDQNQASRRSPFSRLSSPTEATGLTSVAVIASISRKAVIRRDFPCCSFTAVREAGRARRIAVSSTPPSTASCCSISVDAGRARLPVQFSRTPPRIWSPTSSNCATIWAWIDGCCSEAPGAVR